MVSAEPVVNKDLLQLEEFGTELDQSLCNGLVDGKPCPRGCAAKHPSFVDVLLYLYHSFGLSLNWVQQRICGVVGVKLPCCAKVKFWSVIGIRKLTRGLSCE